MKTLIRDLETGNFRQLYLLTGEEAWLRQEYRNRLIRALLPDGGGMNLTVFDDGRPDETEILDLAETLPFFSEKRVIRLDRTGYFKKAPDRLPDYLSSMPEYLYLIFTEDEVDKRSRMYKAVKKIGAVIEFQEQSESVLSSWILRMLKNAGLGIRRGNMQYLLSRTGTDMARIHAETEKLIEYCTPPEVSREDIDAVISLQPEDHVFDMITALTEHRRGEALALYADLVELKVPPLRILFLIAQQYRRLAVIRALDMEGLPAGEIAARSGIPPFAVRKNSALARRYSPEELQKKSRDCAEAEEAVKTGRLAEQMAVELLLSS